MVIAGIALEDDRVDELWRIGVKDSKKLAQKERERLADEIKKLVDAWVVEVLDAWEVDSMTRRRGREGINILEARVFSEIIKKLRPEKAYIDLPSRNADEYERLLKGMGYRCRLILEHKADEKYAVVAAASILAKVERDRHVERLRNELGDFGSGYPSDPKTLQFLRELAERGRLDERVVRLSWRTLEKVLQRRLDEYGEEP